MHAHKLTVTVPESGHVELDLPRECRGRDAEVIVLVAPRATAPQEDLPRGDWKRVQAFLAEARAIDRPRMTKEEIDAYLAEERASWGDEP